MKWSGILLVSFRVYVKNSGLTGCSDKIPLFLAVKVSFRLDFHWSLKSALMMWTSFLNSGW